MSRTVKFFMCLVIVIMTLSIPTASNAQREQTPVGSSPELIDSGADFTNWSWTLNN